MSITTKRVLKALCDFCEHEDLKVTITEAAKGTAMAGGGAFLGALLGGPIGLAVGATIGGIVGAINGHGKYKSVVEIVMDDMTPEQREKLANSLIEKFRRIGVQDIIAALPLMMNKESLKTATLEVLRIFLHGEGYALEE